MKCDGPALGTEGESEQSGPDKDSPTSRNLDRDELGASRQKV